MIPAPVWNRESVLIACEYCVLVLFLQVVRVVCGLFVVCWLLNVPETYGVYLRDGSAQTILRAAILR